MTLDSVEKHKGYVNKCDELNVTLRELNYTRESLNSWTKTFIKNEITFNVKVYFDSKNIVIDTYVVRNYFKGISLNNIISLNASIKNVLIKLEEKLNDEKFQAYFNFISNYIQNMINEENMNPIKDSLKCVSIFDDTSSCIVESRYIKDVFEAIDKLKNIIKEIDDSRLKDKLNNVLDLIEIDNSVIPLITVNDLKENIESLIPTKASLEEANVIRNFLTEL